MVEVDGAIGDKPWYSFLIDIFNQVMETIQNLDIFIAIVIAAILIILSVFSIHTRSIKYTNKQLELLKRSGKYIPKLFVELNESKDVLRYFVFGKKWKDRIIKDYNFTYDNFYGEILRGGNVEEKIRFHIPKHTRMDEIESTVETALDYHNRFSHRDVPFKEDYKESAPLFEIIYFPYIEALERLANYAKAANCNYLVVTGSAGNGKTNLLCSITELAIKIKESVILINSRDVSEGMIEQHILKCINVHKFWLDRPDVYFGVVNAVLAAKRRHLFIIIDAINENDNQEYTNHVCKFVNNMSQYKHIKIIVSCRSEYYKERFSGNLSDNIIQPHLVFDIKGSSYPIEAVQRIIRVYRKHFNFSGIISDGVNHILCEHLLLLRVFFEVYKNSNEDVLTIQKHELFARYISTVRDSRAPNIEEILDHISDRMLSQMEFDYVVAEDLLNFSSDELDKTFDETVLLTKTLVSHEGTIAQSEKEAVSFVFDEMRDYCIARRIMQKCTSEEAVDGDAILKYINKISQAKVSCEEGVAHYAYVFLKTAKNLDEAERIRFCSKILDIYRIQGDHEEPWYHTNHREEFINYGLKIIFTSGLPLQNYEKDYIRDCLIKSPKEDGGKIFDTALIGTLVGLPNDLNLYLEILLGLPKKDQVYKALRTMITSAHTFSHDIDLPYDLVQYHKDQIKLNPGRARQIQKVAELFLLLIQMQNYDRYLEFIDYFYALPDHEDVRMEMTEIFLKIAE